MDTPLIGDAWATHLVVEKGLAGDLFLPRLGPICILSSLLANSETFQVLRNMRDYSPVKHADNSKCSKPNMGWISHGTYDRRVF